MSDPYEAIIEPTCTEPKHDVNSIYCADIHLSDRAPVARSAETDWLKAQERVLSQIKAIQEQYECPLYIAGDIFHRWDASPALISLFIRIMKGGVVWAISGNHDTPHKQYQHLKKSAYWTLVESGVIAHLPPLKTFNGGKSGNILISGFPDGFTVRSPQQHHGLTLNVALIHDFIWIKGTGYDGAPEAKRYSAWINKLRDYDLAVFGDNHKGFLTQEPASSVTNSDHRRCSILNCGGLQCRRSDEKAYRPRIGLLHDSGLVTQHFLDTSQDRWSSLSTEILAVERATEMNLSGFIEDVNKLRDMGLNWRQTVYDFCEANSLSKEVQDIIHACVEPEL